MKILLTSLAFLIATNCFAQNDDSEPKARKSPVASGVLSLVMPGAGQYYNGDYVKGGIMTSVYITNWVFRVHSNGSLHNESAFVASNVLFFQSVIWSVLDAIISSSNYNKKHGFALNNDVYIKPEQRTIQSPRPSRNDLNGACGLTLNFNIGN